MKTEYEKKHEGDKEVSDIFVFKYNNEPIKKPGETLLSEICDRPREEGKAH